MSDSDGSLAKVSYFPGVARPSEPARADTGIPAPSTHDSDGWFVEPSIGTADVDPFASDEPGAVDPDERPASNVAPLRPVVPLKASADDGPVAEAGRPAETPALARMRALIAEAESRGDASSQQPEVDPDRDSAPQRRAYKQKFYAEEPDDEDAPLTPEELAARAERVSMSALTRKGLSSWELAERLRSQDLDEVTVANEVERLERVGLLNDYDLAEMLVRTLQERKGLGRSGIMSELRRRHVDPEAIEEALSAMDTDDESARALEIALKRAPQLRSLDSTTAQRRLSAFLMRKGYSSSAISFAVAGALKGTGGPRFR